MATERTALLFASLGGGSLPNPPPQAGEGTRRKHHMKIPPLILRAASAFMHTLHSHILVH
jgi:hypothetical protein